MNATADPRSVPQRLRRTLELVYGVDGVVAAKVWQGPGFVAIGVRGSQATVPDLLRRVENAVVGLREVGEVWDFGILVDPQARWDQAD